MQFFKRAESGYLRGLRDNNVDEVAEVGMKVVREEVILGKYYFNSTVSSSKGNIIGRAEWSTISQEMNGDPGLYRFLQNGEQLLMPVNDRGLEEQNYVEVVYVAMSTDENSIPSDGNNNSTDTILQSAVQLEIYINSSTIFS